MHRPQRPLSQRLLAEFVGTFTILFIGVGAIVAVTAAGGGQGGAGLVSVAIAHGLAITTMVSAVGHVSGAHFNPAVTIGAWVTQKIPLGDAAAYVLSQIAGATAGAMLCRIALPEALWRAQGVNLGTPLVNANAGISNGKAVLIEAVLTFFLVWVIFATAVDPEGSFGKIAGLPIGFVVIMDAMMGGPFTGAAMNPARSFGPALAGGYWTGHWVYWVGPVAGAIVAASIYDAVIMRARAEHDFGAHGRPEGEPEQPDAPPSR